jgi:hypothetical protein
MCCNICFTIELTKKLLVLKLDGLRKHNGRRMYNKVVGLPRWLSNCMLTKITSKHMCNENVYYIISCDRIWLQIVNYNKVKKEEKYLQFVNCFPSCHFGETRDWLWKHSCFVLVSKGGEHTRQAWTNNNGCAMVKCTSNVVLVTTNVDNFISISCNEFTNINNQFWIFICDSCEIMPSWLMYNICIRMKKKYIAKTSPNLGDLLNTTLVFYILCDGITQLIVFLHLFFQWKNV